MLSVGAIGGVDRRFEDLDVYCRAGAFADELWELVSSWPSFDRWTVGIQLVRSVDSIGANIAEAYGRSTDLDQRRFLYVARGSVNETEHWLIRARCRRLIGSDHEHVAREIGRMLNGLIRSHRDRQA